jgi:hypothetical protein
MDTGYPCAARLPDRRQKTVSRGPRYLCSAVVGPCTRAPGTRQASLSSLKFFRASFAALRKSFTRPAQCARVAGRTRSGSRALTARPGDKPVHATRRSGCP